MSFLPKENIQTVNCKITDIGRRKISEGKFNITQFSIGDSEIDYIFVSGNSLTSNNYRILRPKDRQTDIKTFILQESADTTNKYILSGLTSSNQQITTGADERGFFTETLTGFTVKNTPDFVIQPTTHIPISSTTGGFNLNIRQAPNYGGNTKEPEINDYLLVNWSTKYNNTGTLHTGKINNNQPFVYLWYKIEDIVSGSLSGNNLVIKVDKEVPDMSTYSGSNNASAIVYPYSSGDSINQFYSSPWVSDFFESSYLTFDKNFNDSPIDVPIWNMSIVYTENIAGIGDDYKKLDKFKTITYGGIVSYLESLDIKNVGLIHYTNNSVSFEYGESFSLTGTNRPQLLIPNILWHHNTGYTIGLKLTGDTIIKYLSGGTNGNHKIQYVDLIDGFNNSVGKIFPQLEVFSIEDQELLHTMSYKSNRNWTLPGYNANFNIVVGCEETPICKLSTFGFTITAETTYGANNGAISITGVTESQGNITYSIDSGTTYQTGNTFTNLSGGSYYITVKDDYLSNCIISQNVVVGTPTCGLVSFNTHISGETVDGANDGVISVISVLGDQGNLTYSINSGTTYQTGNTFNSLSAGTYNVCVNDDIALNCFVCQEVEVFSGITTTTLTPPTCDLISFDANVDHQNGIIMIDNVDNQQGNLTYSKNGGSTYQFSNTFTGLTVGSYNICVKDDITAGCTICGNVDVEEVTYFVSSSLVSQNIMGDDVETIYDVTIQTPASNAITLESFIPFSANGFLSTNSGSTYSSFDDGEQIVVNASSTEVILTVKIEHQISQNPSPPKLTVIIRNVSNGEIGEPDEELLDTDI